MTDLTPMWETLAKYQPYADADGHGESWRKMCEQRTREAVAEAEAAADVAYWSELAITRIERAIKERDPAPSNIEPVFNDDGQAQTMDAPEPFDLNEAFRHTPQRQPLSDGQLREALRQCPHDTVANLRSRWLDAKDFARAIEAAHGIGGDK